MFGRITQCAARIPYQFDLLLLLRICVRNFDPYFLEAPEDCPREIGPW